MIDREAILQRKAELQKQLEQTTGTANAIGGAIQDCEYWLSQLEPEQPNKDK